MPRDTTRPAGPPRDADASRARIRAAATAEFARHGLSGARVDTIAKRAKANKRMLYYYYGGKEALFLAVLEAAYARIRGEEQKLDLTAKPPVEGMRELVTFTWRHFIAHPEFISLLNTAWMTLTLPLVLLGPGRLQERQKLCPPSGDRPLKTPYSVAMLAGTCAAAMWVWTWAH